MFTIVRNHCSRSSVNTVHHRPGYAAVDLTDTEPCNLRCALHGRDGAYCGAYPSCAAGYLHRVEAVFGRTHEVKTLISHETRRSRLGGYSSNRIVTDPDTGVTVEEVDLSCRTLKFESLLRKNAVAAAPLAISPPESELDTIEVPHHPA